MSIENSFCNCHWEETFRLWESSQSEDEFIERFFETGVGSEISFPDRVHLRLASWEMLEDFSDWYRDRRFDQEPPDWGAFCRAGIQLGLIEESPYTFKPVNELAAGVSEVVFAALSPAAVRAVMGELEKIEGSRLDDFIRRHELPVEVPFSEVVVALREALDPEKGLIIFAG